MHDNTRSNLLGDILEIAHEAATAAHYVSNDTVGDLSALSRPAIHRTTEYQDHADPIQQKAFIDRHFGNIVSTLRHKNDDQRHNLSRLLALDSLATNAVNHVAKAERYTAPQKRIADFLAQYIGNGDHATRETAINNIGEALDGLIISLVHTMHPTIYHSPAAHRFEAGITALLEDPANVTDGRLTETGKRAMKEHFTTFTKELQSGRVEITPVRQQMTVTEETDTEKRHFQAIREELNTVVKAWNEAVAAHPDLRDGERDLLTIDPKRQERIFELRTWGQSADADGREKSTSQFLYECIRNNTDEGKYKGETLDMRQNAEIHRDFFSALLQVKFRESRAGMYGEDKPNEYTHKNFRDFCVDFMQTHEGNAAYKTPYKNWQGPEKSLFQQLESDHRAEFVSEMIKADYRLVPEQLTKDVLEFNPKIYEAKRLFFKGLLDRNDPQFLQSMMGKGLLQAGFKSEDSGRVAEHLARSVTFDQMGDINTSAGNLQKLWLSTCEANGWKILEKGLQYNRVFQEQRDGALTAEHGPADASAFIPDFFSNPEAGAKARMDRFLEKTYKVEEKYYDASGEEIAPGSANGQTEKRLELKRLPSEDRAQFMDTIKRMVVVNHAIDTYNRDPNDTTSHKVATRYQIANFSEAADFLITLKLFQEGGLVTTERGTGKVTKTKMGIMPLLETGEDLTNAKKIFTELLDNPISESYWRARGEQMGLAVDDATGQQKGYAEIMLGFSDGSATAGNLASQWLIRKAAVELTELFAKKGIEVRFLQGRGRGVDRGGTIDPALQQQLMPPEMTRSGIYDVTIQSDLPMDLAASRRYGEDYFTSILLSTLQGKLQPHALYEKANEARRHAMEAAIDWIAQQSSEVYNKVVRNNPKALDFLNAMPRNSKNSSRSVARGGATTFFKFDAVRAIPKEYMTNGADMRMHDVGLDTALKGFRSRWTPDGKWTGEGTELSITDAAGKQVGGNDALAALNEHPFFNAMLKTIRAGMADYDPSIAEAYGKATKSENFVRDVLTHISDLNQTIAAFNDPKTEVTAKAVKELKTPTLADNHSVIASMLDQLGHGLIVEGLGSGKKARPNADNKDQRQWAETISNALFAAVQEIGQRELPRERGANMALAG